MSEPGGPGGRQGRTATSGRTEPGRIRPDDGARSVLAAVSADPRSGFELAAILGLADVGGDETRASQAFLYPTLHRLEADGRIRGDWLPSANGVLRRRYRATGG